MSPQLQSYLIKKFPKLYTEVDSNRPFALYQFECDDGWFRLILWLSRYLQQYIDQQNSMAEKFPDTYQKVEQIKVVQCKEKFGTLRFYTDGGDEQTRASIQFAEYISGFICESSGKVEDIGYNRKGWIKTHHVSLAKGTDFKYIDDEELRKILNRQEEFKFDSKNN
jgi:hypothetical protein